MADGKARVLITGAASGIGYCCSKMFLSKGAEVCLFDLKGAADAAKSLETDKAIAFTGDATSTEDVERSVDLMLKRFGGVDVLICSAGIAAVEPFFETSVEGFRKILDINVTGPMVAAQIVGRVMQRQRSGSIVFLGSVYGSAGAPHRAAYCASKGAVHNLTRSLAVELGPVGIRVNAVAPTGVRTSMIEGLIDQGKYNLSGVEARCPLGRLAEPDEVAGAIYYLSSEQASMINGAVLPVDGGWLANGYTFS